MRDNAYDATGRRRHILLAIVGTALAVLLFGLASSRNTYLRFLTGNDSSAQLAASIALGLLGIAFGIMAIREGLNAAFAGVQRRQGAVTWRNLLAWSLYVLLFLAFARARGLGLDTVLLGGALASIVLATLAQASLSGIFAGLVLMLARPYRVGEQIYLRSGQFGGAEYEGVVVDIGAFYTVLSAGGELLKVPNTSVIQSVLMTRYRPRRANLEVDIPSAVTMDRLEDALRERLHLAPGSRVRMEPIAYSDVDGEPRARIRLEIFAEHPIDRKELLVTLEAVLGSGVALAPAAVGNSASAGGR